MEGNTMKISAQANNYFTYYDEDWKNIYHGAWDELYKEEKYKRKDFGGRMDFDGTEVIGDKLFANLTANIGNGKDEFYKVKIHGEVSPETGHFIKSPEFTWIKKIIN